MRDNGTGAGREGKAVTSLAVRFVHALASLRLTVTLLAMSIFLVFAGTLAQVDKGVWTVVHDYFRGGRFFGVAWIDFSLFFPRSWEVPGGIPFPSGWLLGAALLLNLMTAATLRFSVEARGRRFWVGLAFVLAGCGLTWMVVASVFDAELVDGTVSPSWRILLQLIKGGGASLVLLVGCLFLFRRKAGIVLMHGAIVLLMLNELLTGTFAEEGHMQLREGESASFVIDRRSAELVVQLPSEDASITEVVIPAHRLTAGVSVEDDRLPVALEVVRYLKNARILSPSSAETMPDRRENPATMGAGLNRWAEGQDEVGGASDSRQVDAPATYIRLRDRRAKRDLGIYLFSIFLAPQRIEIDGKEYRLALRFKRRSLFSAGSRHPFRIELVDFSLARYPGTHTYKDFSSRVRVMDPDKGVDRQAHIWMNNPLRYGDHIFYQSGFDENDDQVSTLQVVRNRSWMIPYVSLMMVATGLLAHFGVMLVRFLKRRRTMS